MCFLWVGGREGEDREKENGVGRSLSPFGRIIMPAQILNSISGKVNGIINQLSGKIPQL